MRWGVLVDGPERLYMAKRSNAATLGFDETLSQLAYGMSGSMGASTKPGRSSSCAPLIAGVTHV